MSTATVTFLDPAAPVTRRIRAYFAPVDRVAGAPAAFDPAQAAGFDPDNPPAPWRDLGWVENVVRKSESAVKPLMSGCPSMPQAQVRETLEASISFRFASWGKLAMALAAGAQHMNVFAPGSSTPGPGSGGPGAAAAAIGAGSTATFLALASGDLAGFAAGCIVVADADYAGQTGFVGAGVSGAYVASAAAVQNDPNYIRRVSLNVARVSAVTSTGLQLAQPLPAGAPAAGMRAQQAIGFVDREGGSFFQEWSGLFAAEGEQGERMFFYYPRLQTMAGPAETAVTLTAPLERIALNASFRALPVTDANDGEQALCFRSYFPAPSALV